MKTPGDWLTAKSGGDFIPLISGKDLTDVAITGKGTIDGNGQVWWGPAEEARRKTSGFTLPRPNLIVLTGCKNVRITAQTGLVIRNAKAVRLKEVKVEIQKGPPFIVENAAVEGLDR
jgi:polygalacturonase